MTGGAREDQRNSSGTPTRPARLVPSVASMSTSMAQHYADDVRLLERERELDVLREGLHQVRVGQGAGFGRWVGHASGVPGRAPVATREVPLRPGRPG